MYDGRPRFRNAEHVAYSILEQMNFCELPINIKAIIQDAPEKITLKSYSRYAEMNGFSIAEVKCELCSEDGWSGYNPCSCCYLILINDEIKNRGHNRWTLAHELGHIALHHHKELLADGLNWHNLPQERYSCYEKEANCFARCLLAPPSVLFAAKVEDSLETIMVECDISYTAAKYIRDFFENGKTKRIYATQGTPVINSFSRYIGRWETGQFCTNCGAQTYKETKYCPICGVDHTQWRGINGMKYSSIELGPENRAKKCPKCDNENIVGDHCQICGTYVVNRCQNFQEENGYPVLEECGKLVSGDARFCPHCGYKTSFGDNGFLESWQDVQTKIAYAKANNCGVEEVMFVNSFLDGKRDLEKIEAGFPPYKKEMDPDYLAPLAEIKSLPFDL